MPRKPTMILGINNSTGDSRIFPAIQTAADYMCGEGFAGETPTNSSVASLITRVSMTGGTAYGWTFIRCPEEAVSNPRWARCLENVAKIRSLSEMVLEYARNPDAAEIIASLANALGDAREIMQSSIEP